VWAPALGGLVLLSTFVVHEQHTRSLMLPLGLFKRRNFAFGNVQTFAMYGGSASPSSCSFCSSKRSPAIAPWPPGSR